MHNDFSYLRDALYVARSFYFYKKKKNYTKAIHDICEVKATDIFVTCSEYLARNIDDTDFDSLFGLQEKFLTRAYLPIADYILDHKGFV